MSSDPYSRLRAVIKAAGQPRRVGVGKAVVDLLVTNRGEAVQFEATATQVAGYRKAARAELARRGIAGVKVSIYRLDPMASGGASRVSTWEAVLVFKASGRNVNSRPTPRLQVAS